MKPPGLPRQSAWWWPTRSRFAIRASRSPATLIGSGQVEALAATVRMEEAGLVVFDAALTPVQQRNLETALEAKVIDRTGLILEIFGERAATAEGRLQVELAHLDYQAGRLVRSWTHLERQRGGFGFLGGPGETQIETDRRLIRDRMARLRKELDQVSRTRGLHRERRQRAPWPVIALVGYTNAGKSTLINQLTGADVMAENLLFATLDPTMREIQLPGFDKAILSDTVGFVSELPTQLVAAFKATLEEVISADLLIHVRDIAHPDSAAQRTDVENVLGEIGVAPKRRRGSRRGTRPTCSTTTGARRTCSPKRNAARMSSRSRRWTGKGWIRLIADCCRAADPGPSPLHHRARRGRTGPARHGCTSMARVRPLGRGRSRGAVYDVRMAERDYERFNQRRGSMAFTAMRGFAAAVPPERFLPCRRGSIELPA